MDLQRGDVVTIALQGDHGEPRPAIVIQSNLALSRSRSVALLPLTSAGAPTNLHRITLAPTSENGLLAISHTMIERLTSSPIEKLGRRIGVIKPQAMAEIDNSLRLWLGLI